MVIDLGFVEERESSWLINRYFPSKVGGKPAWLDLERLPRIDCLKCSNCDLPKVLLCQVYASFNTEESFHRTVYVFYCRSEQCQILNNNCSVSVFRCQLPLQNNFYSSEAPVEIGKPLPAIPVQENLCVCCGCLGPYFCGACKKVHYCSKEHQRKHFRYHKAACKNKTEQVEESTNCESVIFPEFEIVIERAEETEFLTDPEDNEDEHEDEKELEKEKEQLALLEEMKASGKAGSLADASETELVKYANSEASLPVDKYFTNFKKVISKEPSQVIRYIRGGEPLWIANPSETIKDQLQIPKCENCGSERQFEFQIMPQMLNNLNDSRIDWGVLAIYTCKRSCSTNSTDIRYMKEYVIKQDIEIKEKS